MALTILQSTFFFAIATTCIYSGLAFINGLLMPSVFGWFYDMVQSPFWRSVIASITIFLGANYFNAKGYLVSGQAIGGPIYIVLLILGMVVSALLIDKTNLNMHIVGGVLVLIVGALWIVHGLRIG